MPSHDDGPLDELFVSFDDAEDPPLVPWSLEDRRNVLAPVTAFFKRMASAELARWSYLHLMVEKYWYAPDKIPDNFVSRAVSAISGQFDKPALADVAAFIFLDIVFRPRPGQDADRTLGLSLHFHIVLRIAADDAEKKKVVRESLKRFAPGKRAILFQRPDEAKGGIVGSLERVYLLKDWRDPMKSITGTSIKQACNDGKRTIMRNLIYKIGLRPSDVLILKGLRRFGNAIKPAPTRRS
ncbi:hypothetical protein [Oharaeibacter diazotrophicus]|uniref:Uncharacterized protein n=1 Tax=Oharaeibacter diazotrophicus TaxID=1920512 RepID=A0A4R6RCV3_9HYPH|nr:hypothetical protein [Oharaeibacter diazotrophicus]TDP83952.1 hypothetical protein EDD54_2553 [Oharaeibacter diazotrophicus]BBE72992.1 hypothetical protein OHA_1_02597 [Pleomorphomonas sp. SM30]GLS74782.1 hypothetical protein GCM10007904_01170 [Oharaeibacter diazotrophicus]